MASINIQIATMLAESSPIFVHEGKLYAITYVHTPSDEDDAYMELALAGDDECVNFLLIDVDLEVDKFYRLERVQPPEQLTFWLESKQPT